MKADTSNRLWGLGILLLGLVGLYKSAALIVLAAGQSSWVATSAQVTKSQISRRSKGSGFGVTVNARFAYRYAVAGEAYYGDRYSYWSMDGDQIDGAERFREGDRIVAYHHPDWHQYAVIERRQPSVFVWLFMLGSLALAAGGGRLAWSAAAAGKT